MVFHGNKWGWRAVAARLLLAPVAAAGTAAGAAAQQAPARQGVPAPAVTRWGESRTGADPGVRAAPPTPAAKPADPKALLKMGHEALKAGKFDEAQDLARRADAANPAGKWGLFGDTPEALEKDIRAARAKADKGKADALTKDAKTLVAKAMAAKAPADKLAALDEAYAKADQAAALAGPADFLDDVFGDRPDKIKKTIDAERAQVRKTAPAAAAPAKPDPIRQAVAATRPGAPAKVAQAGHAQPKPAAPAGPAAPVAVPGVDKAAVAAADKAAAQKLVAEGRALLRANRLVDARAKGMEAQRFAVAYGPADDSPTALLRDADADAKGRVDWLVKEADAARDRKDLAAAEKALTEASQVAAGAGFQTRPIDDKLVAVLQARAGNGVPVRAPAGPAMPAGLVAQAPAGPAAPAAAVPPTGPGVPTPPVPGLPGLPGLPAPAVAQAPPAPAVTAPAAPAMPAVPGPLPAVAVAPPVAPPTPPAPAPAVAVAPPAAPAASVGQQLLTQATAELRRGDLEMARKLATHAHNADAGPDVKKDAQALLREVDAEDFARRRADAAKAFANAADLARARQPDQALAVLRVLDADLLPPDAKAAAGKLAEACAADLAKMRAPVTQAQATDGPKPAAQPGLADQVKALAQVEFQKLRQEGFDVQTKAKEAFGRGETDLALQMMADYTAKVKGSSLSPAQQGMLTDPVDRRANQFALMKRQTDFVTAEARDKADARDRTVGKALAEDKRRREIGAKVREVNDLIKAHKYRDAEALALQTKALDPDDPAVATVYELAKRQRAVADAAKLKDDKAQMVLAGLNSAENPGKFVDTDNPLALNVERSLNAMRRGTGDETYLKARSPAEREIELKLDKPMQVEFRNASLREVIDSLRKEAQVNISVDEAAIQDDQIALDQVRVTEATVQPLALKSILTLILEKARLKYVVENDVIKVTTEKKATGRMITKLFSVMDLVTPIPDFSLAPHQQLGKAIGKATDPTPGWVGNGPTSKFSPNSAGLNGGQMVGQSGAAPWATGPAAPAGAPAGTLDNRASPLADSAHLAANPRQNESARLMKIITGMVRPYSWAEMGGPGKVAYYDIGGALVVNQTADIIREVQDLLEALRRLQETSVAVEIRVISLSEAFFERVGVDFSLNIDTLTKERLPFERALTTGQFRPDPFINSIDGNALGKGLTVGFNPTQGGFTPDLNIPIRSTSYGLSVPPFGGYAQNLSPALNGGLSVGLAFLNDIQVYMFMEAAQGDRRVNVMQAPKVTLFNGQTSTVFVSELAFFTLGIQVVQVGSQFVYLPQNSAVPVGSSPAPPGATTSGTPGVSVTVQAIVSSDRRFVRLNLAPTLTSLTSASVPLFPVSAFITPVFEGGSQGQPIPFTQFFQQPSISEISVQTTVAVPDGGTVVLGGLKTLAEGRNEFGPPVLSKIPYLNRLFRNQGIGRETRHIMIMVTPRIIIQSEEEFNQTGTGGGGPIPNGPTAP